MNIKKMLSIIMVAVLCLTLFSGCGEEKNAGNTTTSDTTGPTAASGKTITLVGGMENMGFYESLKKGGEEAAKKYGFTPNKFASRLSMGAIMTSISLAVMY